MKNGSHRTSQFSSPLSSGRTSPQYSTSEQNGIEEPGSPPLSSPLTKDEERRKKQLQQLLVCGSSLAITGAFAHEPKQSRADLDKGNEAKSNRSNAPFPGIPLHVIKGEESDPEGKPVEQQEQTQPQKLYTKVPLIISTLKPSTSRNADDVDMNRNFRQGNSSSEEGNRDQGESALNSRNEFKTNEKESGSWLGSGHRVRRRTSSNFELGSRSMFGEIKKAKDISSSPCINITVGPLNFDHPYGSFRHSKSVENAELSNSKEEKDANFLKDITQVSHKPNEEDNLLISSSTKLRMQKQMETAMKKIEEKRAHTSATLTPTYGSVRNPRSSRLGTSINSSPIFEQKTDTRTQLSSPTRPSDGPPSK